MRCSCGASTTDRLQYCGHGMIACRDCKQGVWHAARASHCSGAKRLDVKQPADAWSGLCQLSTQRKP